MKNGELFEGAAHGLIELLARISPQQWEAPGLGSWSVRSLAGHAGRSILTVEEYLAIPAPTLTQLPDAESYFLSISGTGAGAAPVDHGAVDHEAVAQRGVDAGIALGEQPALSVRDALARTMPLLAAEREDRIVRVLGDRSIRLDDYLRTRVFELVVHTLDLSRATELPAHLPAAAVEDSAALAARIAVRGGRGEALLLALTGRMSLPEGFSVV